MQNINAKFIKIFYAFITYLRTLNLKVGNELHFISFQSYTFMLLLQGTTFSAPQVIEKYTFRLLLLDASNKIDIKY